MIWNTQIIPTLVRVFAYKTTMTFALVALELVKKKTSGIANQMSGEKIHSVKLK